MGEWKSKKMVMSLFSVFDPVGMVGLSMNWVELMVFLMVPLGYFMVGSKFKLVMESFMKAMLSLYKESVGMNFLGIVVLGSSLFFFLMMVNSMGLVPYVFTSSSHLMVTMSLGGMMWLSSFLMGWIKNVKNMSAHLVPEGSPLVLAPFMVLVEMISQIIRPVTLSVRLAANMMAGHLIIGLIASLSEISLVGFIFSFIIQVVMMLLEIAVSIIQAFVFSILVLLYFLESY